MITDYSHITQLAKSKGELMQMSFGKEILFWTPKWKFYYFVWSYAKTRHKIYIKHMENVL